jgi:hypothetical protein
MMQRWVVQDRMTDWSSPTGYVSRSSNWRSRSARRVDQVANTRTRRRRVWSWYSTWRHRRRSNTTINVSVSSSDWERRSAWSSTTNARSFGIVTSHRPGSPTRFGPRSQSRSAAGQRNRPVVRSAAGWRRNRNAANSSNSGSDRGPTSRAAWHRSPGLQRATDPAFGMVRTGSGIDVMGWFRDRNC